MCYNWYILSFSESITHKKLEILFYGDKLKQWNVFYFFLFLIVSYKSMLSLQVKKILTDEREWQELKLTSLKVLTLSWNIKRKKSFFFAFCWEPLDTFRLSEKCLRNLWCKSRLLNFTFFHSLTFNWWPWKNYYLPFIYKCHVRFSHNKTVKVLSLLYNWEICLYLHLNI